MKVLELRFKNLNSLYGEWIIDFTEPEYIANGIFALTGPTGAGKSTILDAICLALYGATPRLGKITSSGNEIMSRQTGECYAEVLFESQAGRFRCHWEQRRARKKADGKLQDQEHQISDADTGKPIETKKSFVIGVIEKKTGMDFDRFTRSILLAQGGFDTFLKANVEQKSKILEQITGTEIYSEISRRVHERQRDEKSKLDLLQAETSGIEVLEPEQEKELQVEIAEKKEQGLTLASALAQSRDAIAWLARIANLKEEINRLTHEAKKIQEDTEDFRPQRTKLERALKAASLDGVYATLKLTRKQQKEDAANLEVQESRIPNLENHAGKQSDALKVAEQVTLKAKDNWKKEAPLITKIRSLDEKIDEQAKAISDRGDACKKEAKSIEADKHALEIEKDKLANEQKALDAAKQYLKDHSHDEYLVAGLSGLEENFRNLANKQGEITQKKGELQSSINALEEAESSLEKANNQCVIRQKELDSATSCLKQSHHVLNELLGDKLLREYRTEKENLLNEKAYVKKIEELEDQRAKLEDGHPCPLCGATEHPYAEGNIPVPDAIEQKIESLTELITKAENQEGNIKTQQESENIARKNLSESEGVKAISENNRALCEEKIKQTKAAISGIAGNFNALNQTLLENLKPLGIEAISETSMSSLLDSLRSRLKSWQRQLEKREQAVHNMAHIDGEFNRINAVIETKSEALVEKRENLRLLEEENTERIDERKALYGDKDPDIADGLLHQAIATAEEEEKKARAMNVEAQQNLNTARANVELLKKRIEQRESELDKAVADFSTALTVAGFAGESLFLDARLTHEERESLACRANELDNAQTSLKAKQQEWKNSLVTESKKNLTEKTLDELEPQQEEGERNLQALRENFAALKHKLDENKAAKERIKDKQNAIEKQKKESLKWHKLNSLIGSADGKKYRNFAQGLTFELMVSHANRQLEKMTDRYLLIRDGNQPLELNVVDNYQAGEIRSTKNLSGGESFIVSLSLALGLAKMASRKVRVDSLFLDEGFGTLDDDALEIALETLSGLQQGGKLIGVISHVNALKERISTQISVMPLSGGRSSLSGIGCTKVANS